MRSLHSVAATLVGLTLAGTAPAQTKMAGAESSPANTNLSTAAAPVIPRGELTSTTSREDPGATAGASAETPGSAEGYLPAFTTSLTAPEVAATGVAKLTAEEQAALDALVGREITLAHAGNVHGFAGTFTGRRTPAERARAGLDRLTPDEQARLNMLVALALAAGPAMPEQASSLGRDALAVVNRLQVHGELTLTVGGGSGGRSFYGTSLFTTITDPSTNLTIGVGYSVYHGNGYFGYGPDDYYYPYAGYGGRGFGPGGYFRRH